MEKKGTTAENVQGEGRKEEDKQKKQCMWLCHKRYSKKSRREVQYTSYNGRCKSTVRRASLMRHVY